MRHLEEAGVRRNLRRTLRSDLCPYSIGLRVARQHKADIAESDGEHRRVVVLVCRNSSRIWPEELHGRRSERRQYLAGVDHIMLPNASALRSSSVAQQIGKKRRPIRGVRIPEAQGAKVPQNFLEALAVVRMSVRQQDPVKHRNGSWYGNALFLKEPL